MRAEKPHEGRERAEKEPRNSTADKNQSARVSSDPSSRSQRSSDWNRIGDLLILDRHPVDPRESDEPIHSSHSLYPSGYLPFLPAQVPKCFRARKKRTEERGFNSIRLSRALRKGAPYLRLPTVTTTARRGERDTRGSLRSIQSRNRKRELRPESFIRITSPSDDDSCQLPEKSVRRFRDTK